MEVVSVHFALKNRVFFCLISSNLESNLNLSFGMNFLFNILSAFARCAFCLFVIFVHVSVCLERSFPL